MLATILKRSIRHLAWVGLAVALGCSSADEATEPELATMVVEILPASLTILPGGSESFTVTVTHSEDFTGTVHLTVIDAPAGITGTVSGLQTIGQVTTATVTIGVDDATSPANYTLVVRAFAVGAAPGAARLSLTVAEVLLSCPLSGQCEQWAIDATASSEYTTGDWSARQATGRRNVIGCADDIAAWASLEPNGVDWLELIYQASVRPTEIQVYEANGTSSIVQVEVGDGLGTYHTVYTAQPARLACPRTLTIAVTNVSTPINVIRLHLDQRSLNEWNEIDAVKLIGTR